MATAAAGSANGASAGHFTGEGRLLQINTPLGPDHLVVRSFVGHEAVSELFWFEIDLASEDFEITASKLVAQPATLKIYFDDQHNRYMTGYVSHFSILPSLDCYAYYRIRIVPWLWFLSRTTNCMIYQNMSVPEIVEAVFQKYKLTDFRASLQGSHPKREYCVQYRETACDFVMRLLEEEGICFFFEHTEDKNTLVLSDYPGNHQPCPLDPNAATGQASGPREEGRIFEWMRRVEVRPHACSQGDYQFKTPRLRLLSTSPTTSKMPFPNFERYDYPGGFTKPSEGDSLTDLRMEEEEAGIDVVQGRSGCRSFVPGYTMSIVNEFHDSQKDPFLILSVDHEAEQGLPFSGEFEWREEYENRFSCMPRETPFRPPRVTPRPQVAGPHTAFVTGPSGEEIYTDQYGRIKVQFHWDREGKYDDNSSCWVRVAQTIAGKGWGSVHLPRVGQEVIVEFLEGDPDRPLVTGCVYNADQTPPYKLPDNRSMSLYKSFSYPGGGGFNELRFEDKKDNEQIFIHGQKDMDVRVKNDRREWMGRDTHLIVKRDKLEEVDRDKSEIIQRDHLEQIQRDHHVTIQGKEAIQINGSLSLSVKSDVNEQITGNHSEQVTQNYYVKGMNVVIEALTGLTIKVGANHITINPAGIQMFGTMVMINSGGSPLTGSPGSLVSPSSPAQAAEADNADPGSKTDPLTANGSNGSGNSSSSSNSAASNAPWHNPNSPDNKDKRSWIEIELVDDDKQPVPGEAYRITLPDGSTLAEGTLDEKGRARIENIDPGSCKVTFPRLDKNTWKPM